MNKRANLLTSLLMSQNAPAAFIAKGVKISNSLLGKTSQTSRTNLGSQLVVALQLSDSTLNEVMLQRTGLGETGESYLVGPDLKLRTSTRDPNRNLASSLSGDVSLNGRTPNLSGWP